MVRTLAVVDLVLLLVTAGLGTVRMRVWLRHRGRSFPTAKAVAHPAAQVVGTGVWTAFIVTGDVWTAWSALVVLTTGQVLGDMLMLAGHRARPGETGRASYMAVAGAVLSFRRPTAALHALAGALAWFGMLALCIAASAQA